MLVTNIDAPTGGVQKNSRLLLNEFNNRGIETYVCARNYFNLPRKEIKDGTSFLRSPVLGSLMAANSILYLIDTLFWLVINRGKYDVIHCQQIFGPTMAAAIANFFINRPILTRITLSGETGEANAVRQMMFSGIRLRLLNRVSKWVALSEEMKSELETLGILPEKIKIIHNAAKIPQGSAFEPETREKYRRKLKLTYKKIVVFSGRLSLEKDLNVLINAWKAVAESCPETHLLLLGQGGEYRNVESELKSLVEWLDLSNTVHFMGYVSNVNEYLLASDVFVLPSQAEGLSNALVEAFACGTAIVASDIAANREICEDGVNSLLFQVGETGELASAILEMFESPETAHQLGIAARKKAEAELGVDKMIASYIDAYQDIIQSATE